MHTDFKVTQGIITLPHARTSEIFEAVNVQREVVNAGIMAAGFTDNDIETVVRILIEDNWGKFRSGQGGDRGGFRGHFEHDMEGVVRQVMKPLKAYEKNLEAAAMNLTRFTPAFRTWMAPIARPDRAERARRSVVVDGGW